MCRFTCVAAVVRGREWRSASFYAARQSSYSNLALKWALFVWRRRGMKREGIIGASEGNIDTGEYQIMERERNKIMNEREYKPQYVYSA